VKKAYLPLIIAVAFAGTISPVGAQQQDTGASGVIDGSDVYQFLNSGSVIDPTRMEEASRKFDSMIKMPERTRQCKNWQEVIDRDRALQDAGVGAVYKGDGTNFAPGAARQAPSGVTAPGYSQGKGQPVNPYAQDAPKPHGFFNKLKNDFVRYSEWVGFPISDEPLPGDVDASLAGDLPAGPDPRVYVHETKHQPYVQHPVQQSVLPVVPNAAAGEGQPPTIIMDPSKVTQ